MTHTEPALEGDKTPKKPKSSRPEPTELLPPDDPVLKSWTAMVLIMKELNLPKTRKFRRLRVPRTQRGNHTL
jgi:hypothetical protein